MTALMALMQTRSALTRTVSGSAASLPLGEELAISLLREEKATLREPFDGFSFTRFDGTRVTI
jgi:hypothetical protein